VYVLANTPRSSMQIQITDVKLNTHIDPFGRWAQGMITRYLHSANSENPTAPGRPKVN
jgi:hypothetical protein